jgi:hypothetical protein
MGAHQLMAPPPVDLGVHLISATRERARPNSVDDVVALLADIDHREPGQGAGVVGLAATGRVEGGPI